MSSSKHAIDIFTYSNGPIHSTPPTIRFLTGLTNLETVDARNIPAKNLFFTIFSALSDSSVAVLE
jgi:hypothetical protein